MMKTINALWRSMGHGLLMTALTLSAGAAWSVQDLKGGPAVNQLDLHPAVTAIAREQQWLHYFMLVVCSVIFIGVFGVMFYSILKHRKSKGAQAAHFHESTTVEIVWTVIPFLIVIAMAWPATKVVVAMKDTSSADLTIKATGMQWKWGYEYLRGEGEGISFLSTLDQSHREMSDSGKPDPSTNNYLLKVDQPLVVPEGKKVRIITTATDVIHAWMVPAFGVKQDAIPGFVRDTWFRAEAAGDYYGQCAELCGKEHAYMPIHVKVLKQDDYAAWVAAKKEALGIKDPATGAATVAQAAPPEDLKKVWARSELMDRGQAVYAQNCAACHQANGQSSGPIKPLDGSAVVLSPDKLKQIKVLLAGQNNGAMPAWAHLSNTEIAAVITFTKNNWSNKTGQIVQPAEVAAARK
jgi:cytochrome c oxidase subunit 2